MKIIAAVACAFAFAITPVQAQSWPNKPITLIVSSAPGGPTDLIARFVGDPLGKVLGQPVLVVNKPGASGNIGAESVIQSPADGYTLLMQYSGYHVGNPALIPNLRWNPTRDFTGVALVMRAPHVIASSGALPVSSLKELIDYGRKNPNGLSYASSGSGSILHIAGEMFRQSTGIKTTHIPYKGAGPAVNDLMGGQVDMIIGAPTSVINHEKSGKVRLLAVTAPTRHPGMPHVPTTAQAGMPGFEVEAWFAIFAKTGTPEPIIARLAAEIQKIVETDAFRKKVEDQGAFARFMGPEELNGFVEKELPYWKKMIEANNIKAD